MCVRVLWPHDSSTIFCCLAFCVLVLFVWLKTGHFESFSNRPQRVTRSKAGLDCDLGGWGVVRHLRFGMVTDLTVSSTLTIAQQSGSRTKRADRAQQTPRQKSRTCGPVCRHRSMTEVVSYGPRSSRRLERFEIQALFFVVLCTHQIREDSYPSRKT